MNRNNTNEMLPDNSTGKGDGAVKRTQNTPIAIAKQGEEPDDHERTTTETVECIGTDKLDPTIGSTGKTQQDRNAGCRRRTNTDEIKHIKTQQR
jgi:hypothetical protein